MNLAEKFPPIHNKAVICLFNRPQQELLLFLCESELLIVFEDNSDLRAFA